MEEKAIVLIEIDEYGKCKINKDAIKIIESINAPISSICVAGKYRTGKSFLLNRLLNRQNGFKIGSTTQPCTKGIWMWSKPIEAEGTCALLLDTEGLFSCNRDAQIDTKIFTIAVLLCSFLIYNTINTIDESAIEALSFVTNLSNYVHIRTKNPSIKEEASEFAPFFPFFLWVVRDFNLKLISTEKQYLENALRNTEPVDDNALKKNKIRESISNYFKERDCITMVRPVNSEEELRNIDNISYEKLKIPFREQCQKLVNKVFTRLRPKSIDGVSLNGRMYSNLITKYVGELNSESLPAILTTWEQIVEAEASTLAGCANREYEEGISKITLDLPIEDSQLRVKLYQLKCKSLDLFSSQELQGNHIYGSYLNKFNDKIRAKEDDMYIDNRKRSEYTSKLMLSECLETLTNQMPNTELSLKSIATTLDNIRKQYYSLAKGPAKYEVYDMLMNAFTFNLYKRYIDQREDEHIIETRKLKSELSKEEGINKARLATLEMQKKQYEEQSKELMNRYKLEGDASEASVKKLIENYEQRIKQLQETKIIATIPKESTHGGGNSDGLKGTINDMIKYILEQVKQMKISVETDKIKLEYEKYKSKLIKECNDKVIEVKQAEKLFYNNVLDSIKITISINEGKLKEITKEKDDKISQLKEELQIKEATIEILTRQMQEYDKDKALADEHASVLNSLSDAIVAYINDKQTNFL